MGSVSKKNIGNDSFEIKNGLRVLYHNSKFMKDDKDQYYSAEISDFSRRYLNFLNLLLNIIIVNFVF